MRRTRHRRRFHTDRIVRTRRARYLRETRPWEFRYKASNYAEWLAARLSYGRLADRDPWDCGNPRCGCCHFEKLIPRRARENREWRQDWQV